MNLSGRTDSGDKRALFILIAAFVGQWLLLFVMAGPTWDAVSYYSYARSVLFDRDLSLANDFQLSYPTATPDYVAKQYHAILTETGRAANLFAVGSSLLWLPWLLLLQEAGALTAAVGAASAPPTGYEWWVTGSIATLSALLGFFAFWLSYRLSRPETDSFSSLLATVTLMFATPLIYYQFRDSMYSHASSAFTTALVVTIWWRQGRRFQPAQDSYLPGALLGAAIGLAGLVRWQNLLYLTLPLATTAFWYLALPAPQKRREWAQAVTYLAFVLAGALVVFSLQMAVWRVLYGSYFTVPQGSNFMNWRGLYIGPLLLSSFRGLLPWMPVTLPALAGLLLLARRQARLAVPLLILLALEIYANGSTRDWFAGGGFGPRRFTSELAIFVIGFAAFLNWLPRRLRGWLGGLLLLFFALHQWLLLRYGLPERLGGRVLSMAPTFDWEQVGLTTFIGDLGQRIPAALARPLEFLVLAGSPLDLLANQGAWPWRHVAVLLLSALFLLAAVAVALAGGRRMGRAGRTQKAAATLLLAATIVAADLWIVLRG